MAAGIKNENGTAYSKPRVRKVINVACPPADVSTTVKLRPYRMDAEARIAELEAEAEKMLGGYRMILNSTDIEICDGDFARTIAKQMIEEANK